MSSYETVIDLLVDSFPRLFKGRPPRVPSDLPSGWAPIVLRLLSDVDMMLDDEAAASFEIHQIKEKLASLRVYWSLGGEETRVADIFGATPLKVELGPNAPSPLFEQIVARVRAAEAEAAQTCQFCGQAGRRGNKRGWLAILCEPCAAMKQSTLEDAP